MNCTLHRGAEADLLEAARFYRREGGPKLAGRFLDEFDRVVQLLLRYPGIGSPTRGHRRVHPMRGFPYSVIYREFEAGNIRVLVVQAQRRDPSHGEERG